jgi:hypothetical protein
MYQLRDMLGEPWDFAKEDPLAATPGYFRDMELMDYIHAGEMQVAEDIGYQNIPSLLTVQTRTTVDGTNTYFLPGMSATLADDQPIQELLSIEMDAGAGYMVRCEVVPIDRFVYLVQDNVPPRSAYRPLAAVQSRTQIIVSPTPGAEAGANKLQFRYIGIPKRRYKQHHGIVSSATATTLTDTDLTEPGNYWTTDAVLSIRLLDTLATTANAGIDRLVTNWDAGGPSFTVAFPWAGTPVAGTHYLVGECSSLDDQLSRLALVYAAYQGLVKDKDPTAQMRFDEYRRGIEQRVRKRRIRSGPHVIPETRYGDEFYHY